MRESVLARGVFAATITAAVVALGVQASEEERPQEIEYPHYPPAPRFQPREEAEAKSASCRACHGETDQPTMHRSAAVVLGCRDCHGGDATVEVPPGITPASPQYATLKGRAHVPARYPQAWGGPGNPERSYTLLNREAPEHVRFVNPGDLRVADEACGACHGALVENVKRSLMATTAMFWGGAAYNNGILPFKRYVLGEAYTKEGQPARIVARNPIDPSAQRRGVLPYLLPLPAWETVPPADNFRVFERGGRNIASLFPEIGLPNPLEEPGRPDIRQSNRGPGTGARIAVPVLNLHKTRLNDPLLWFLGTNDHPGDFRSSGCSACHVVYANDRDPVSAGPYAPHGHWGQTHTRDPAIRERREPDGERERGHPLEHVFTRAIPSSTCMTCHMHQPNMFLNSYLGYTMWDYEADAPLLWSERQQYPTASEMRERLDRNPEEAVVRGRWADREFLSRVWDDVNPQARHTQFADYHGHGWNFRAVYKRDRDGALLDAAGAVVADELPPAEKWKRAVHLRDIHAERGMHCVDCHFSQDSHGDGSLYGEVAAGVEIRCADCHGAVERVASLRTSGPAAPPGGSDLSTLRNADGRRRFVWRENRLYQRLALPPHPEREVPQVRHSVTPGDPGYNARAARAKTVATGPSLAWGERAGRCKRAHREEEMACFTCHSSWVTSCAGCHLPIQANWKTERHHYEGGEARNFASYNPQVARDQMFQLGRHGEVKNGIVAPIRSSSALVLSSTDINRNRIYVQQPPISSSGFSSQAFAPHFPHTVRKTETKTCSDCHVSAENDNNAILSQLLLQGTGYVNFVGLNAWVGTEHSVEAIQVTEFDEPQAVLGSYLHRFAYPDWYQLHFARDRELLGREMDDGRYLHHSGRVGCLQLRGEYLYVAEGEKGFRVYDVSSVANKGFSERIITAPFSPLGQDTQVPSRDATCVALPTNQPIRPDRNRAPELRRANLEQEMHPVYSYVAVTDREEGLILVDVETLADFEPRNNFLHRALTFNPDGLLDGARHAVFAGHILYVSAARGIVVVDLDTPLEPRVLATVPLRGPRAAAVQFRYLFALDEVGLQVVDVTRPEAPRRLPSATVPLADARRLYLARTYAYIAAGSQGLAIVDVERPEAPRLHQLFTAEGRLDDVRDVVVASTNASLFAYVANGRHGLAVLQLTSPESQPRFYGFSPEPRPEWIAWRRTSAPALSLSRGLERDRGVDETGHQIAVFGRIGSRPFTLQEMRRLYLAEDGRVWTVSDEVDAQATAGGGRCEVSGDLPEAARALP